MLSFNNCGRLEPWPQGRGIDWSANWHDNRKATYYVNHVQHTFVSSFSEPNPIEIYFPMKYLVDVEQLMCWHLQPTACKIRIVFGMNLVTRSAAEGILRLRTLQWIITLNVSPYRYRIDSVLLVHCARSRRAILNMVVDPYQTGWAALTDSFEPTFHHIPALFIIALFSSFDGPHPPKSAEKVVQELRLNFPRWFFYIDV